MIQVLTRSYAVPLVIRVSSLLLAVKLTSTQSLLFVVRSYYSEILDSNIGWIILLSYSLSYSLQEEHVHTNVPISFWCSSWMNFNRYNASAFVISSTNSGMRERRFDTDLLYPSVGVGVEVTI